MSAPIRSTAVLGVPVDDVTLDETVDVIAEMVEAARSTGRTHQVATVNVDFVVNALDDPHVLRIMQLTDLSIPDGAPLVWFPRLAGTPVRERTAGADLVGALAARAVDVGWRVVLFGGAPGVAAAAREVLLSRHPGADLVAVEAPAVGADGSMADDVVAELAALGADIVCVALGNPKQERWIERHRVAVGAGVYIGVGGTLDFIAGRTQRAPMWVRRVGLEWLHRALSEPRRLVKRYARDIVVFLPRAALEAARGRLLSRRADQPLVRVDHVRDRVVQLVPAGDAAAVEIDGPLVVTPLGNERDPRLGAAVATIVRAGRRADEEITLSGASARLRRTAGASELRVDGETTA